MKITTNLGLKKIELTDSPPDITVQDANWDSIDKHLNTAVKFQKAGGTGTAITLSEVTLEDGFQKTFVVTANNSSVATKINGKNLYKPGGTAAPNLITGKAVTVWYDLAGDCFFIKASAEGDAVAANVLAGKKFSNDNDTGIVGTLLIKPEEVKAGANIGGTQGTFTNDATATADQILNGRTAYVNGSKITGAMPNRTFAGTGNTYQWADTTKGDGAGNLYVSPQAGYYDKTLNSQGFGVIKSSDYRFVPENILSGVSIFGVAGTASQSEVMHNFPLTIQDAQPTAIKNGHIWVKSSTLKNQINAVYIVDMIRANDPNSALYLVTGNRDEYHSYGYTKQLSDGTGKWFGDVTVPTPSEATWLVSENTNGMTQSIKYRPPMVYSKVGDVLDIETAYMWNGTAWVMLSQKGKYLALITTPNTSFYNLIGENLSLGQTLTTPIASAYVSFSKDGTYFYKYGNIYKRNGDVYSAYSMPVNASLSGNVSALSQYSCVSGDGSVLYNVTNLYNGSTYQLHVIKFVNNGSAFVYHSMTPLRANTNSIDYHVLSIETNNSGSAVAFTYRTAFGSTNIAYVAFAFTNSSGVLVMYNTDLASLYSTNVRFYLNVKYYFIGDLLVVVGYIDYYYSTSFLMVVYNVNYSNKSVTYSRSINTSPIYENFDGTSTTARINDSLILIYDQTNSPYLITKNVVTGATGSVSITGYAFTTNDNSGGACTVNIEKNMVILAPRMTKYFLKFRLAVSGNNVTLTFLEKVTYTGTYPASEVQFIPQNDRD